MGRRSEARGLFPGNGKSYMAQASLSTGTRSHLLPVGLLLNRPDSKVPGNSPLTPDRLVPSDRADTQITVLRLFCPPNLNLNVSVIDWHKPERVTVLLPGPSFVGCDFNWSMQHTMFSLRAGGVAYDRTEFRAN